tara:strand:+ start:1086 stop:1298 length:213 start_codon:yes stop_codon:yes gene_type:complete
MPGPEINRNYDSVSDPEAAGKRQTELDEMIKEFLAKGGKIEKIPTGMTGEEYKDYKKGISKKKKKSTKRK